MNRLHSKRIYFICFLFLFLILTICIIQFDTTVHELYHQLPLILKKSSDSTEKIHSQHKLSHKDILPIKINETCPQFRENITFYPPPSILPFKENVIMTLLSPNPNSEAYYENALSMIYQLLYVPQTKLTEDVEVAIMMSKEIPVSKYLDIVKLGARIIIVPTLYFEGISDRYEQWQYCYTKLFMFHLINYKRIVYYDSDFLFQKPISTLFPMLDYSKNHFGLDYFFGAVQDYGLPNGTFNAGFLLFEPSCEPFEQLISLASQKDSYDFPFMEQGLLNWYFKYDGSGPSGLKWFNLPTEYNVMYMNIEKKEYQLDGFAFHNRFWIRDPFYPMYHLFYQRMAEMKAFLKLI